MGETRKSVRQLNALKINAIMPQLRETSKTGAERQRDTKLCEFEKLWQMIYNLSMQSWSSWPTWVMLENSISKWGELQKISWPEHTHVEPKGLIWSNGTLLICENCN